ANATAVQANQQTVFDLNDAAPMASDLTVRTLDVDGDNLVTALPGGYPAGPSLDGSSNGGDWANILLNFRETVDYAAGVHLSMLSNEEMPGSLHVSISDD